MPKFFISPLSLLLLLPGGAAVAVAGDSPVPVSMPADRYAEMGARSPFAVATLVPVIPQPGQSFAANWYVSGMAQLNGEDFVSIRSRDQAVQFSLHGQSEDTGTGVSLAGVEWSGDVGHSTVILRRGTETARLEFNPSALGGNSPVTAIPTAAGFASPKSATPVSVAAAGAYSGQLAMLRPPEIRRRIAPIPAPR